MKFVQENCSICGKRQSMQVVQENSKQPDLIWVKCPECNEIKPVEIGPDSAVCIASEVNSSEQIDGQDKSSRPVRHYRSGEVFVTGEWIYHPGWKDTGKVVDKKSSKGGKEIIIVEFEKLGTKRLVSNFAC